MEIGPLDVLSATVNATEAEENLKNNWEQKLYTKHI